FQSAQDLAFALRSLLGSTAPEKTVSAPGHRFVWPAIAAVFLITTLALWFVHFRLATSRPREVRFATSPPDGPAVIGGAIALAPGGNRPAFVAWSDETPPHARLWIHSFDTGKSQLLSAAGDVSGVVPVWSPDGRYIAFVTDGAIRKIALSGGAPQTVVDGQLPLSAMTWSADDIIVFGRNSVLMKVSAAGGPTTPLTALDPQRSEIGHFSARFLSDGRH